MARPTNRSKALAQLEYEAGTCRSNPSEAYKEVHFDSIANRIFHNKATARQVRYWAERHTEWRQLNGK